MPRRLWSLARRALRKPPRVVARRLATELSVELERVRAPVRQRRFGSAALLRELGHESLDEAWTALAGRPFPFKTSPADLARLDEICPGERGRVIAAAEEATAHRVDLLGSGPVSLGRPIDWHVDVKTGRRWPVRYGRRLDFVNLGEQSDVKVPWEISRLQWLLPLAQTYLLGGDERYAKSARDVTRQWIAANPYARGVNWAIAMEAAFRIFSWTYLFHALSGSEAWREPEFRGALLRTLFLHGEFVERNLERSDVNGNHFTADAVGLVAAGLFFGDGRAPRRWADSGWQMLLDELPRQVHPDGVDFEASTAYHRLVAELFLLAALLRESQGLEVPPLYRERLEAMGRFTAAYVRPDGDAPHWGDADDARALPLGGQGVNDHGYLPALMDLAAPIRDRSEVFWWRGAEAAARAGGSPPGAERFESGGVYVLRRGADFVFVDCGAVGLAGRGGHGHNDSLSFEAALDGVRLVTDCGTYVYTAELEWRNRFRSTAFHNTPLIDGAEQAHLDPELPWTLGAEATPEPREWRAEGRQFVFRGAHAGYRRLPDPVTPVRTFTLDTDRHELAVHDEFEGSGDHEVRVPLHLAPGVAAEQDGEGGIRLLAGDRAFAVEWAEPEDWELELGRGWFSPSYGIRQEIVRLEWSREGLLRPLHVRLSPARDGDESSG